MFFSRYSSNLGIWSRFIYSKSIDSTIHTSIRMTILKSSKSMLILFYKNSDNIFKIFFAWPHIKRLFEHFIFWNNKKFYTAIPRSQLRFIYKNEWNESKYEDMLT
jgi:hypothetical protein